ncbi:glutamate-rich protein 6-like [Pantherophis guttatus]|uniref:Glutamate-rich protein 6-like n=1 Tax=Pantherophis guttatus TaxID=94885 RepID=A0ABM3YQK5_PANGU|nr:glutamate-rich protein 6-like [Pantherophis guttatus]
MSKTPNPTKTGSKKQVTSEASPDPAPKPESSKLSSSLLTVENVKKHQEENPVAKSDLAQWSIETYIEESNRFLTESGTKTEESREQAVSNESRVLREGYPENANQTLGKDFQTRPLSAPVPETQSPKKREVADLETQTEWSYSVSSEDSSELEIETKEQRSTDGKEKSETTEGTEILHHAEEEGTSEIELETGSISDEEKIKSFVQDEVRFQISDFFPRSRIIQLLMQTQNNTTHQGNSKLFAWKVGVRAYFCIIIPRDKSEEHPVTDLFLMGRCEFCTSFLKPLPSPEELEERPEKMEHFLCCRTYKEVFQCVIQELMERPGSEIDIRPHGRLSLTTMESNTKRMIMEELEERGFERYREIFMQYIKFGPCIKIHFKLSDYPPKPETAILKKRYPEPKELLEIDLEFKAEQLKLCHPFEPVKRYYHDGKIFFLLFPDGTGQVYYPSGRLALLIAYVRETQFTYSILGDRKDQELLAFFTNQGHAAYYQQKEKLRLHLDLCNGSVFDKKGQRQKFWNWWGTEGHVHAPPFQPICLQLNVYIQVKIKAQDQVFFTFTKVHDCLCLNVGARLKLKDPAMLWVLQQYGTRDHLVRPSVLEKISRILANVKKVLKNLDSDPSKEAADLRLVSKVYERIHRRQKKK